LLILALGHGPNLCPAAGAVHARMGH
jgi:hypothetical protein